MKIVISNDLLVATRGEDAVGEIHLPVIGSFRRCIEIEAFPDQKLLIVEWHEGSVGTSSIYTRVSLLAYSVDASGIVPSGAWVLVEALQGASGLQFLVNRSYEIEQINGDVDIVFTGMERVSIEMN